MHPVCPACLMRQTCSAGLHGDARSVSCQFPTVNSLILPPSRFRRPATAHENCPCCPELEDARERLPFEGPKPAIRASSMADSRRRLGNDVDNGVVRHLPHVAGEARRSSPNSKDVKPAVRLTTDSSG